MLKECGWILSAVQSQVYFRQKLMWIQANKSAGSTILVCLTVAHTIPTRDFSMPSMTITKTSSLTNDMTEKTHAKVVNYAPLIFNFF